MSAHFGFTFGINTSLLDPDAVLAELESIREREGLTPRNVVSAARPANSLLHPAFEWNDQKAAELHREFQARCLIKSVRVSVTPESDEPAFVHVATRSYAPGGEYQSTSVVVRDDAMRRDALRELREKVAAINRTIELLTRDRPLPRVKAAAKALKTAVEAEARA